MKKSSYMILLVIAAILAMFFFGKHVMKTENTNKATVELTVYTISSSDAKKWRKVKQVETEDAVYLISAKEVASSEEIFSNIIADGAAMGFGVSEEDVTQFNSHLETAIEDSKKNTLIDIEYLTFSDNDAEGFAVANFDYGKKEYNSQKNEKNHLYQKLYEAFKA